MKIFLMADNWVGWKVTELLRTWNEEIVGLALHSPEIRKYGDEILEAARIDPSRVFSTEQTLEPSFIDQLAKLQPDIILSVFWGYLLKPAVFKMPRLGTINFHAAYLPYNRGKNPNVWPIVEGTPAGVTLHYIDEGIDSGDIISRREVPVEIVDTAQSVYHKLTLAFVDLFKETWPKIKGGSVSVERQDRSVRSFHLAKDFKALDEIFLDKEYKARDLINQLRAKTFPPHPSAYFMHEGKKVFVRIQLSYE